MATRGQKRHLVSLYTLGPAVPDGDGGYTNTTVALDPPTRYAEIKPATARELERLTAGTVLATASHVVTMDYHPGVNTQTKIVFRGRTLSVTGVSNPNERNIETIAICVEVVT